MGCNEVERFKEKYKKLLDYKQEMNEYIARKKELEKTNEVIEYLKICKIISSREGYSFYGSEKKVMIKF